MSTPAGFVQQLRSLPEEQRCEAVQSIFEGTIAGVLAELIPGAARAGYEPPLWPHVVDFTVDDCSIEGGTCIAEAHFVIYAPPARDASPEPGLIVADICFQGTLTITFADDASKDTYTDLKYERVLNAEPLRIETGNSTAVPTEQEITQLPRWARVALAARCARRVLPLLNPHVQTGRIQSHAAVRAVSAAENYARGRYDDDAGVAREAAKALGKSLAKAFGEESPERKVATTAAYAARCAHVTRTDGEGAIEDAVSAVHSAALAGARFTGVREGIRRDFNVLAALDRSAGWKASAPVPPEVFGPLWPYGPPPGWPDAPEPTSEDAGLVFFLDVPEGLSEQEVLQLVRGLAEKADTVHRAYGGHGLQVESGNIEITCVTHEPAPAGGRP